MDQLTGKGFTETRREPGPMDSGLIEFAKIPLLTTLSKDRGQWSVDLDVDGWKPSDRVVFPLFHGFGVG